MRSIIFCVMAYVFYVLRSGFVPMLQPCLQGVTVRLMNCIA